MTSTDVPSSCSSLRVCAAISRSKPPTKPKVIQRCSPQSKGSSTETYMRIVEYLTGFLTAHAVLAPVGKVLGLVPFEANACHMVIVIINL